MKKYLYANGIVKVATADEYSMNEYLYENGYPREEAVAGEWENVEELNIFYKEIPDDYIILEVATNQELLIDRGFKLESKAPYREIYTKDNVSLILDWTTYMYINVEIETTHLETLEYSAHQITTINWAKLDSFLQYASTFNKSNKGVE